MIEIVLKDEKFYSQRELIRDTMQRVCKVIANILLDGISRGIFRPDISANAEAIALNLLAYLDGIGMYYYVLQDNINQEEQINLYLDELLNSLRMEDNDA